MKGVERPLPLDTLLPPVTPELVGNGEPIAAKDAPKPTPKISLKKHLPLYSYKDDAFSKVVGEGEEQKYIPAKRVYVTDDRDVDKLLGDLKG